MGDGTEFMPEQDDDGYDQAYYEEGAQAHEEQQRREAVDQIMAAVQTIQSLFSDPSSRAELAELVTETVAADDQRLTMFRTAAFFLIDTYDWIMSNQNAQQQAETADAVWRTRQADECENR